MEILTAAQMRRVDAHAIDELGIPGLTLMESAGRGVADALVAEIPGLSSRPVVIVCGKGNNGGDGLVTARYLRRSGVAPRVVLLAHVDELKGDAAVNARRAKEEGVVIDECGDRRSWQRQAATIDGGSIVVDALLGTGARGAASGLLAEAIEGLNASGAAIVSIDLPSGIDTDTGALPGPAVRARRTFTLCRPKPGLVLEPAASHAGSWSVIGIGIPDEAVAREAPELVWFDGAEAAALVPDRPPDAHKGTFGHLLAVCGSKGKTGAAVLAARGALRSGVGLVTVATPASILPIVAGGQPEAMTEPLPESSRGTLSRSGAARVLELLASRDALMIGPGLSTDPGTRAAVLSILARRNAPAVLDADGLNAAASVASRTKLRAGRHPLVLTPHPGEAARLLGIRTDSVQADRLGSAHALAIATSAVVVLKGRHSIVAEAGGRASFNATGNPGMATGGTGDALTGVIGALLARGLPAFDAARLGTYVHGAAGDAAAERTGPQGLIAGDLIEALPAVWGRLAAMRRGVDPWTREA